MCPALCPKCKEPRGTEGSVSYHHSYKYFTWFHYAYWFVAAIATNIVAETSDFNRKVRHLWFKSWHKCSTCITGEDWNLECHSYKRPYFKHCLDSTISLYKEYGRTWGFDIRQSSEKTNKVCVLITKYFVWYQWYNGHDYW